MATKSERHPPVAPHADAVNNLKSSGAWSGIVDGLKNNKGAAIGIAAVATALIGGAVLYSRHRKQKQQEEAQNLQR